MQNTWERGKGCSRLGARRALLWQGFPLWGSRTFPLNTLLSPDLPAPLPRAADVCQSTDKLQRPSWSWSWGTAQCVHSKLRFCWSQSKAGILIWWPVPDICCLFCNIPQTALSTAPEPGISAEKSSKLHGFKPGKLVFNYFPFIPVNHKKGWIPCSSCCAPPRELCRCRPTLLQHLGGCWSCCGNTILKED